MELIIFYTKKIKRDVIYSLRGDTRKLNDNDFKLYKDSSGVD